MIFTIAWRNVWRHRVRSLVIMTSVALGVWAGLTLNSLYIGMGNERLKIAIENEVSHIQIHHPDYAREFTQAPVVNNIQTTLNQIETVEGVKAVCARTMAMGMLATATGSAGVQITGIQPPNESRVTQLQTKIKEGTFFTASKPNGLLIGAKLAKKFKIKPRSKVILTFQDASNELISAAFWVEGIYQTYNTALDEVMVYVNQTDLNKLLNLNDQAHEIAILLRSDDFTTSGKNKIAALFPDVKVQTWKEISPDTELIIATMTQASMVFVIIILLAISFGIINTMLMAILERTREIGVLMSLGMNKLKLFTMILTETLLLVLVGCPVGVFIAWLLITYLSKNGLDMSVFAGESMGDFGFSNIIYPDLLPAQYVQIIMLVLITALVSSVFPAVRALRLKPVEAIRA